MKTYVKMLMPGVPPLLEKIVMSDLKSTIPGHFEMTYGEHQESHTRWEFHSDGRAIQDEIEMGTWDIKDQCVVIQFNNKKYGHVVLSLDDDNTLLGEHVWKSGKMSNWILKRITI